MNNEAGADAANPNAQNNRQLLAGAAGI